MNLADSAVCSYGVLERSSRVLFNESSNLQELLSFFSLIEAVVLYEKLWYLPWGDYSRKSAERKELVSAFIEAGILEVGKEDFVEQEIENRLYVRKRWDEIIRSIGNIPSTIEFSEEETLNQAFHHAFNADAGMYHVFASAARENRGLFTEEGLRKWENNIIEPDINPDKRFMDWEILVTRLAHATFVESFGADYISDAIEQPVIQLSMSMSQNNIAAQLYARISNKLAGKVEGLIDAGLPSAISIPPIISLVLERSNGTPTSVIAEAIVLREEFSEFRSKYTKYHQSLSAPQGKTLGELVDQQRDQVQEVSATLDMFTESRTDSRILQELVGGDR